MFTLFYAPGACSLAPHVTLEWIGKPYESGRVRYQSAELLAVNPAGSVPVLQRADGWTLTQAGAILHFLVRKRLALLDQHLVELPFILGERRSIIDAYAFPMLRWAVAKLPESLRDAPHVAELHDRLAADADIPKVFAEESLS